MYKIGHNYKYNNRREYIHKDDEFADIIHQYIFDENVNDERMNPTQAT